MKFEVGFEKIKKERNMGIKLPEWEGFWVWRDELHERENDSQYEYNKGTILMCCKDGFVKDIRDTVNVGFTIENMLREDWEIVELAPEFMIYPNFKDQGLGEELKYCWEM